MRWTIRLLIVLVPVISLAPIGRLVSDWYAVTTLTGEAPPQAPPRGFDWIHWDDQEGEITATYVYPGSPAYQAGMRSGATLYQLAGQQFFSAEDVKQVVQSMTPGASLVYEVIMPTAIDADGRVLLLDIPITRYPTFLYPLSGTLWHVSVWGFALATFLHILGLVIVAPLASRSRRARRTLRLFTAASLWVGANLARLLIVSIFGPPEGGWFSLLFNILTLVALAGWILFPVLLLNSVMNDSRQIRSRMGKWYLTTYIPPILLAVIALPAIFDIQIGPLTVDTLIGPILFYVCCYVAAATAVSLILGWSEPGDSDTTREVIPSSTAWSRAGSSIVLLLTLFAALSVPGIGPLAGFLEDAAVGWLILLIQLLSLAPIGLVSVATLSHGRSDTVVSNALAYLAIAGGLFFVMLTGFLVIERLLYGISGWTRVVVSAAFVVLTLIVLERLTANVRKRPVRWLMSDRQRGRQTLRQFGDKLRLYLDPEDLADATVHEITDALQAGVALLHFKHPARHDSWIQKAAFSNNSRISIERLPIDSIHSLRAIWARNPEFNEVVGNEKLSAQLIENHVALIFPLSDGSRDTSGFLLIGNKEKPHEVYNLEDIAELRTLTAQLILALDRLTLIEREKALVRRTAQAHLRALRAQINPHFLFNTLNTIAALIAERPNEAEQVVVRLSRIFRYILHTEDRPFVPLRDEIRVVRDYLAIEQSRFGDALEVIETWDESLMTLPIPAFSLQTLVENAVKHGIELKPGGGTITLSSRASGEDVILSVEDSGVGLPDRPASEFFGVGLKNVSDRLEQLYDEGDLLSLTCGVTGGTIAEIRIPRSAEI